MENKKAFAYTYSAKKQEEILSIRRKYGIEEEEPSEQEKILEQLRKLDESTTRPGLIASLAVGIVGTLVMGAGMSMAMTNSEHLFVQGIIVGVVGIAGVILAYPVYKKITERKMQQNAPKIRELSDKLLEK